MNIHEHQGKEIFRDYGINVPAGIPAFSVEEAVSAADTLGGNFWVVKAQIHAGGRGKGGGVLLAKSREEVPIMTFRFRAISALRHEGATYGRVACQ